MEHYLNSSGINPPIWSPRHNIEIYSVASCTFWRRLNIDRKNVLENPSKEAQCCEHNIPHKILDFSITIPLNVNIVILLFYVAIFQKLKQSLQQP